MTSMEQVDVPLGSLLPVEQVRFPVELKTRPGFQPDDPRTWPKIDGRLEYVGGRLLYRPPYGDVQGTIAVTLATLLGEWAERHPEFVPRANEAGMRLSGETRAADAAVWLRSEVPFTGGLARTPPILAGEIAGEDAEEPVLLSKAQWYLDHWG